MPQLKDVFPLDEQGQDRFQTALYKGQVVTLIPDTIANTMPSCLGNFGKLWVFDFTHNITFSTLIDHLGPLSPALHRRIQYDILRRLESPNKNREISGYNILLDFGLRPLPLQSDKAQLPEMDPDISSYYRSHLHLLRDKEEPEDLDREVDSINLAYLWSGYSPDETPDVKAARGHLRSGILDGRFAPGLGETLISLEDSPLKNLLLAIAIIEGLVLGSLEMAEKRLTSVLRESPTACSRTRVLTEYLLAKSQVQRSQPFSRERMLLLANTGNLFAQVFISRYFVANVPVIRHERELEMALKLVKTGYGVSQALLCL